MKYGLTNGMPIVPVSIGVSAPRRAYLERLMDPVPADIVVMALVDTGATLSVIDQTIVSRLCLVDSGFCTVRGFNIALHDTEEANQYPNYDVSFSIMSDAIPRQEVVVAEALQVISSNLLNVDFQILIGLDILRRCTLFMDLSSDHFDIAPSSPFPMVL